MNSTCTTASSPSTAMPKASSSESTVSAVICCSVTRSTAASWSRSVAARSKLSSSAASRIASFSCSTTTELLPSRKSIVWSITSRYSSGVQ